MFRRSVAAAAAASFGGEVAHQSALVLLVALDALDQIGVGGDERKIEQLGVGFLLGVDPFLLVTLERRRALDGVERFRVVFLGGDLLLRPGRGFTASTFSCTITGC